jgi:energy-coupling factor transporter ATP-binding protein EcfA2
MTTPPGIVASGVRRSFGNVHAVRDVTLEALPGRVTGLVGPNGSGKTTLLLMLSSLLAPDAGQIRVGGIDPLADPQAARAILGWMPDALGAWGSLTARETLVVTARLYGMPPATASAPAVTLLAQGGYPRDLFGQFTLGIRSAQVPPETDRVWDDCAANQSQSYPTPRETIESTTPSWFVGLGLQVVLAGGLLWWGWARTRTPARRLPPGTRIA